MPQIFVGEIILTIVLMYCTFTALCACLLTLKDFRDRQQIGIMLSMYASIQTPTLTEDQRNLLLLGPLSGPARILEQARINSFKGKAGYRNWLRRIRRNQTQLGRLGQTASQRARRRAARAPERNWPALDAARPPSKMERLARGEAPEKVLCQYPVSKLVPEGSRRAQSPLPNW